MRRAPLTAVMVCAGLAAAMAVPLRADVDSSPVARLTVALTPAASLPAPAAAAAKREVEAIWAPQGIAIHWTAPGDASAPPVLRVLIVSAAAASPFDNEHRWPVAELLRNGEGRPVAIASITAARRVLAAADQLDGPDALVAQRLGVVLGRAVAHELGHFLLNTSSHARHGLMRARIDARDFADPRTGGFGLDSHAAEWARSALTPRAADGVRLAQFVYQP